MNLPRKAFTLAEANALLPALEGVLADIARSREEMEGHVEQLKILDALWGRLVMAPTNPDHGEFLEHREGAGRAGARPPGFHRRGDPRERHPFPRGRA